jgi:addiction module HigA family antidote
MLIWLTITERKAMTHEDAQSTAPREIIREDCLRPLGLSVTAAAEWLGVSRQTLSDLLNGKNGVSAEMVISSGKSRVEQR